MKSKKSWFLFEEEFLQCVYSCLVDGQGPRRHVVLEIGGYIIYNDYSRIINSGENYFFNPYFHSYREAI
jgi:hypothetical protein